MAEKTLFCHPDFSDVADRAAGLAGGVRRGALRWEKFKDGWPNQKIEDPAADVHGRDVYFLGEFSRPENAFENLSVIQALARYFADKVHVVVPFFPVGTMERVDEEGDIATARTFMRLLSCTPAADRGMTGFHTFDIHDQRLRFYGSDAISLRLWSAAGLVRERLAKLDSPAVAFPDEGAAKRFGKDYKDFPQVICSKVRRGDERLITVKEGDPAGRDVVIVDDLIQSGGTMVEASKVLRAAGAKSVGAYATHGVFPQDSHRKLAGELDFVWTTNTIPANARRAAESGGKMECMDIAGMVADIIKRT